MAILDQLAGSGAAGIIAAPFILILLLHRVCALWRDWAATRTHAAHHAAIRAQLPRIAGSARDGVAAADGWTSGPACAIEAAGGLDQLAFVETGADEERGSAVGT